MCIRDSSTHIIQYVGINFKVKHCGSFAIIQRHLRQALASVLWRLGANLAAGEAAPEIRNAVHRVPLPSPATFKLFVRVFKIGPAVQVVPEGNLKGFEGHGTACTVNVGLGKLSLKL